MRRRGSQTSSMLKPTISIVQGEMRQSDQEIQRTSLQQPPPSPLHASMGYNVTQSPQHSMQWQQHQQQYNQQQANVTHQRTNSTRHHSFASSMDLISPSSLSTSTTQAAQQHQQTLQNNINLFKSSSHHTSHTAAAGDLLTMSRRALDPPPSQDGNSGMNKKRSSTGTIIGVSAAPMNQFNFMNGTSSDNTWGGQMQQQHQQQSFPQHQQPLMHTPQQRNSSCVPSSSSTFGTAGMGDDNDNAESYNQHRTIRRCRRSDSFEMMEDG